MKLKTSSLEKQLADANTDLENLKSGNESAAQKEVEDLRVSCFD
jgi:hypothetical protein